MATTLLNPARPKRRTKMTKIEKDKLLDSLFEKQEFLKKLVAQYDNPEFQDVFKKRGTQIHYLSGEEKIGIMEEQSINLLKQLLK